MLLLCDIAMILMNFHTLLIIFGLTYYLSAPQCQFLFSDVFLFQVSPVLKMLQKVWENTIKNQHTGSFRKSQSGATTKGQVSWWRALGEAAPGVVWTRGGTLAAPSPIYF